MAQDTAFSVKITLNVGGRVMNLATPKVMGIINITPDSFYQKSRFENEKEVLNKVEEMIDEGADFIDIGGYSSRPGADDITIEEEIDRVAKHIQNIATKFPGTPISIDTFRSEVAKVAVEAGANVVNDISGGQIDKTMFQTIGELKVPYILMHMKGTPQTMVRETSYENLLFEMIDYFQSKMSILRDHGVKDIVIDPGFGFAKTKEQSYEVLRRLQSFSLLEVPILAGVSRKSMI
ncbi:MAG: dihydropteroate synthase, partial [Bacteroidota bacterium]